MLLALAGLLVPAMTRGQGAPPPAALSAVRAGSAIRAQVEGRQHPRIYRVLASSPESLTVRECRSCEPLQLPLASISSLQLGRRESSLAGSVTGALLGLTVGMSLAHRAGGCGAREEYCVWPVYAIKLVAGGMVGSMVGAIAGSALRVWQWQTVELPGS